MKYQRSQHQVAKIKDFKKIKIFLKRGAYSENEVRERMNIRVQVKCDNKEIWENDDDGIGMNKSGSNGKNWMSKGENGKR